METLLWIGNAQPHATEPAHAIGIARAKITAIVRSWHERSAPCVGFANHVYTPTRAQQTNTQPPRGVLVSHDYEFWVVKQTTKGWGKTERRPAQPSAATFRSQHAMGLQQQQQITHEATRRKR